MTNTTYQKLRLFSPVAVCVALAPAALVVTVFIVTPSFKAMVDTPKATHADCLAINEPAGRLACYDALARELPVPAKGGQAIISLTQQP